MSKDKKKSKKEKPPVLTPQETVGVVIGAARKVLEDHSDVDEASVGMGNISVTLKRKTTRSRSR